MNPEDLLTDALHDRVERTDYPSTPLSAVAGRAGAIRARRRRTTALAAAAAVAVVAVPGAVWLGRSPNASPQPSHELSSGPTNSPTASPTNTANPTTLADLPLGAKPGIDYLVGDTYVGNIYVGRLTAPVLGRATAVAPVRGGLVVSVPRSGPSALADLVQVSSSGTTTPLGCGSGTFALSTDGTQSAYWVKDTCSGTSGGKLYSGALSAMSEAGPGHVATPRGVVEQPVGFVGGGLLVNDVSGRQSPQLVLSDGTSTPVPFLRGVSGADENNNVISGDLKSSTTTSAVIDASTGAVKWQVRGWYLGQFSDDGKYVLAQHLDGSDTYAIFDAVRGTKVAELGSLGGFIGLRQPAWDFNDTLLAVASDGHEQAIVRFDLKGHVTRATATKPVTDGTDVYRLATRP